MSKVTATPARPNARVLPRISITVEIIPIRDEVDAMDVALEAGRLLAGMTTAEQIAYGRVDDRRFHHTDRRSECKIPLAACRGLLTPEEVGAMLGVTADTVRRMVKRGELESEKRLGRVWIERPSVVEVLANRRDENEVGR